MLSLTANSFMTTKPNKPGTEVDSYCTKCRMDLLHRIIAVHNGRIIRVECRTCGGHHNYRRPKSAPAPQAKANGPRPATQERQRTSSVVPSGRKTAAVEAEKQREA